MAKTSLTFGLLFNAWCMGGDFNITHWTTRDFCSLIWQTSCQSPSKTEDVLGLEKVIRLLDPYWIVSSSIRSETMSLTTNEPTDKYEPFLSISHWCWRQAQFYGTPRHLNKECNKLIDEVLRLFLQ